MTHDYTIIAVDRDREREEIKLTQSQFRDLFDKSKWSYTSDTSCCTKINGRYFEFFMGWRDLQIDTTICVAIFHRFMPGDLYQVVMDRLAKVLFDGMSYNNDCYYKQLEMFLDYLVKED